jgi:hypothetical protein
MAQKKKLRYFPGKKQKQKNVADLGKDEQMQ